MKSKQPLTPGFPFYIDKNLKRKLDLLIGQLKVRDVWMIIDGDEGSGKTNTAAFILYYVHCMTNREFTLDRFYFDSDAMFNWVKENSCGLVNWDEAALGGLNMEWWNTSQKNLLKFAMTGRKKHHFFVLCIPKFNKLNEYLRLDRSHALVHMHTGKHNNLMGHFMYLTRRGKAELNKIWGKSKIRAYQKCMYRYGGFAGYIPYVFPKILNEEEYEKKKDEAIASIGTKKKIEKMNIDYEVLKMKLGRVKPPIKNLKELSEQLGIGEGTIRTWRSRAEVKGIEQLEKSSYATPAEK